jgi:hypothetical protein
MTLQRWTVALACCIALVSCGREEVVEPRVPGAGAPTGQPVDGTRAGDAPARSPFLAFSSLLPVRVPAPGGSGKIYVSAVSGTRQGAVQARISGGDAAQSVVPTIIDGGFDPVPLLVREGDTIRVAMIDSAGVVTQLFGTVARAAPPRVVRTSPARGRTDTPLNTRIGVVFSAPIPRAYAEAGISLFTSSGDVVPGRVEPTSDDGLAYAFVPDGGRLAPGTAYRLEIAADLRDVLGSRLAESVTVQFETEVDAQQEWYIEFDYAPRYFAPVTGTLVVGAAARLRSSGALGALIPDVSFLFESLDPGSIRIVAQDGRTATVEAVAPGRVRLVARARGLEATLPLIVPLEVSPQEFAGRRLLLSEGGRLVMLNGDGSGRVELPTPTAAYKPSIGPDARIVYSSGRATGDTLSPIEGEGALYVRDTAGTIARLGDGVGEICPAWSPDGSRIASSRPGANELVIRRRDGTVERIVPDVAGSECAHWTPDGTRLYIGEWQITPGGRIWFASDAGPIAPDAMRMLIPQSWRISDVDALANGPYPPMTEWWLGLQSDLNRSAAWSADGAVIAVGVLTEGGRASVWLMSADGVRRAVVPGVGHVDGVEFLP